MADSPTDELEDKELDGQRDAAGSGQEDGTEDDNSTAGTSTAEDAEKPSMLDAIKSALGDEEEQPSGSDGEDKDAKDAAKAATGEGPEGAKPADGKDADLELSEEEAKGNDPKTRRIRNLVGKVREAHDKLREAQPAAERMARIEKFVEEHQLSTDNLNNLFAGAVKLKQGGLTDDDFRTGVEIMVAVNNDPQKAYELLMPLMESLAVLTGDVLSPELQKQVQEGQITEEAARELSRGRAGSVLRTSQQTEAQKRAETEAAERVKAQKQQQGDAVASGLTNWENQWKGRDPDFSLKYDLWKGKMDALIARIAMGQETPPTDAKAMVALAEQYKKEVEVTLQRIRPQRAPMKSTPQGVGTSTGSKAAPSSFKEAISAALNQ